MFNPKMRDAPRATWSGDFAGLQCGMLCGQQGTWILPGYDDECHASKIVIYHFALQCFSLYALKFVADHTELYLPMFIFAPA